MTVVRTELSAVAGKLKAGVLPDLKRIRQHKGAVQALIEVGQSSSLDPILEALRAIEKIPRCVLYRRELLREMERALEFEMRSATGSLREAAWKSRNRARHAGRMVEHRTISRTLLIKGLEFDHAVVLNAADHDARNLYVAMTRASRSLTVLSPTRRLKLEPRISGRS
jgi:DNA helicase-2/ATP-dependent DNA helicase PcrA